MNAVEKVQQAIKQAIAEAVEKAGLTADPVEVHLESPKDKANGDYATNIAMQLTRTARKAPKVIAEAIVANVDKDSANIEKIEIAGPGFINITIKKDYLLDVVKTVLDQKENYGRSN